MTNNLSCQLHQVLDYGALHSWKIFPLNHRRLPFEAGWQSKATSDLETISSWLRTFRSFGLITGSPNQICVLDFDCKREPIDVVVDRFVQEFGPIPKTVSVRTPSGGYHFYFHCLEDLPGHVGFRPSVDVRSKGNYVVLPPSLHEKYEAAYFWQPDSSPSEVELSELPENIHKAILNHKSRGIRALAAMALERGEDLVLETGVRNTGLCSLVGSLFKSPLRSNVIHQLAQAFNHFYCNPPLPKGEVTNICLSIGKIDGERYGQRGPREN